MSTLGDAIARLFAAVVAICDRQGLISHEMFAIDGVKPPSNASKRRSGTRADLMQQATKLEAMAQAILVRHRAADELPVEPSLSEKEARRLKRLQQDAAAIHSWLAEHTEDRRGPKGTLRQSNRTDNESAKMATGKGVVQGYTGAAAVDGKHQIVVEAQAHGTGSEQEVLLPIVDGLTAHALLTSASVITADAGYHSEENLAGVAERQVEAVIADTEMRQRDDRFATQERHRAKPDPLHDKGKEGEAMRRFQPKDFTYDAEARTCVCPAGKSLYRAGQAVVRNGYVSESFRGAKRDCSPCPLRARCLRDPEQKATWLVSFFRGRAPDAPETHTHRMKRKIDTPAGREQYAARFGIVEPVFGNLCYNKGLVRFTLRGRRKVDGQWKLFCLVHNIEKLAHHRHAA